MPEINKLELHSEEIQELMGFIPRGIVRWGLTIIFLILAGIIAGSFFFRSPEIVTAPMVLITEYPPVQLLSKATGKIDRLFVQEGQQLADGTLVALINNPTGYNEYLQLKQLILATNDSVSWDKKVFMQTLPVLMTLGELQPAYSALYKTTNNFRHYLNQNLIPQKISLLRKQANKQEEYHQTLLKQKDILDKDIKLSEKTFFRDSTLYNHQAISESEYEKSRQSLLAKRSSFIGFEASLKNTESSVLQLNASRIELEMQYEKELAQFRLDQDEVWQNLENTVHQWEEKYLVSSPVCGKISFTSVWSENQEIKAGELIATVIPDREMAIVAKAVIPTTGFGKVEVGQKVNIKLSGFPYIQFGMLKGRIRSVSMVPEEKGYVAEIELTEGMTSSYRENLRFIQQMDGTAEIITKDLRLIYRFINPLRALMDNGLK